MRLIVTALLLAFLMPICASAEVSMPDLSALEDEGIITDEQANGAQVINITDKLFEGIGIGLSNGIKGALPMLGLVVASLVLSAIADAFADGESLQTAFNLLSALAVTASVYPYCVSLMDYIAQSANTLSQVLTAVTAGCTTLYVLQGATFAASVNASSMYLLGTMLEIIGGGVLMPFLQASLALAISGTLPGVCDLSPINRFVKNTLTTVMAFVFTIYGFANYIQTAIATAADSYAYRTLRFTTGVSIPVIGNMLGEASRTVAGSISVIKSAVGSAGIAAVAILLLPPIITVWCYRLCLSIASTVAGLLGCERQKRFLSDVSGIFGVLFALVVGMALVIVITLSMFIRMEVSG